MSWRTMCLVLAGLLVVQTWRGCNRTAPPASEPPRAAAACRDSAASAERPPESRDEPEPAAAPKAGGFSINGHEIPIPAWARWFAPQPGEDLLAYRDRMVPVAQAVLAPHRARVARSRDDLAAKIRLDTGQLAALDAATKDAAAAIEEHVLGAVMSGDFDPSAFKPMTGVSLARDVLDIVERANKRFVDTLSADQRAALAQHPFDFADYLVFSTKWEEMLGLTN